MKIQVRFRGNDKSKEKNYVYTTNSFFKFILIWITARRNKAHSVLTFFGE